jgi:LPPG:FO 2-phospho-L-lactate transferase
MTVNLSQRDQLPKVLALSGGVGGAKLLLGLYHILDPWDLAIVANTGDDFRHLGLYICPDLDTIMYTMSGTADRVKGWGQANETWNCLDQLKSLGASTWFGLGDRDLAVHLHRTERLQAGESLSAITGNLFDSFNVQAHVYPMTDQPVGTIIHTNDGRDLPFQHYFVRERCVPQVRGFTYSGASTAAANQQVLTLMADPDLQAIILCPSNPFVSINPILEVGEIRKALRRSKVPIVAVSPLVGGQAVKGPLAAMLTGMGQTVSNRSIAEHYQDFLSGIIIDKTDARDIDDLPVPALALNTMMNNLDDRKNLSRAVLDFAARLGGA